MSLKNWLAKNVAYGKCKKDKCKNRKTRTRPEHEGKSDAWVRTPYVTRSLFPRLPLEERLVARCQLLSRHSSARIYCTMHTSHVSRGFVRM
ncbi:hypothetical protein GN956_G14181 [Arapaima gigas]